MAVPRVYVRRGTTVWIGTDSHLTDGRTNIDFFIPLHNRPQRGNEGGYLRNTLRGGVIFYFYRQNQLVPGFGLKIEYVIDETEL